MLCVCVGRTCPSPTLFVRNNNKEKCSPKRFGTFMLARGLRSCNCCSEKDAIIIAIVMAEARLLPEVTLCACRPEAIS